MSLPPLPAPAYPAVYGCNICGYRGPQKKHIRPFSGITCAYEPQCQPACYSEAQMLTFQLETVKACAKVVS